MINSLDGIQVIDTYTVTKYTSSTLYCIMLAAGLIVLLGCILLFIRNLIDINFNFNFETVIPGVICLLIAIILIVSGIIGLNENKDYPAKIEKTYYKITVDDNLNLKKLLEHYTIVDTTDLTLIVTEKEND